MTKGDKITQIALKEVGTVESPFGSNKQKYGEWFGYNGVPWCFEFVSWCYDQAGTPLGKLQYQNGIAGVEWAVEHVSKFGTVVSLETIRPGNLICFDWDRNGHFDHVAIFNGWKDKEKGLAYTIEGNTAKGNDSNGGQVMSRSDRNLKLLKTVMIHPRVLD